ncbi:flavodoxin domain-containing protein [Mangrovibacillus cuniculi]|uniref:Flavodoxin n=1 Tax=Mangrovibacillus cuniculi TaxID=2593652 RepID=A0A7S8CD69_9BACI|nr:flavodoxin domain-containing protein [Mangrovibacillus cuniculi]QPC47623.1 flavodoxin [Mangrovibacillus cuniculi]
MIIRALIIYHSISGNTEMLAGWIQQEFEKIEVLVDYYTLTDLPNVDLSVYDIISLGTYTWGNGDIPREWDTFWPLLHDSHLPGTVFGVFGTGDTFYPNFCGAVTRICAQLESVVLVACALKVELQPQEQDRERCAKFTEVLVNRVSIDSYN